MIPVQYVNQTIGSQGYRVLGLDLDGVCADYVSGFRNFCAQRLGLEDSHFPRPHNYNLVKAGWPFRSVEDFLYMHREAVAEGLFAQLQPYEGLAPALQQLSEADVHIRIVSHRLILGGLHRRIVSDTATWLDRHSVPYMSLCFTGLKDSVQASVHIEDSPSMISALRAGQSSPVLIFDQPYNRDLPGLRVEDWSTAVPLILEQFEEA